MFRKVFKANSRGTLDATEDLGPVDTTRKGSLSRNGIGFHLEDALKSNRLVCRPKEMSTKSKLEEALPHIHSVPGIYFEDFDDEGKAAIRYCISALGSFPLEMDEVSMTLPDTEEDSSSSSIFDPVKEDDDVLIMKEIEKVAYCIESVEREITNEIMKNHEAFGSGVQRMKGTEVDMAWALNFCKETRKHVSVVKKDLCGCFLVLKGFSRVSKRKRALKVVYAVQRVIEIDRKVIDSEDSTSVVKALEAYQSIVSKYPQIKAIKCVRRSVDRLDHASSTIHVRLINQLTETCKKYSETKLVNAINAFAQLSSIGGLDSFDTEFRSIFFRKIEELLVGGLMERQLDTPKTEFSEGDFTKFCTRIDSLEFVVNFVSMLRISSNILFGYHKISELISSKGPSNEHMEILRTAVLSNRGAIWEQLQSLFVTVLATVEMKQLTASNTEDVVLMMEYGLLLVAVGEQFADPSTENGTKRLSTGMLGRRTRLKEMLKEKCEEYFDHYHVASFEFLYTSFRNDSWGCLPIGEDFSIQSIKELRFRCIHRNALDNAYEQFKDGLDIFSKGSSTPSGIMQMDSSELDEFIENSVSAILTSSSMNVIRFVGAYVSMIRSTVFIRDRAFNALLELFQFHFYSVFTAFGLSIGGFFTDDSLLLQKYPCTLRMVIAIKNSLHSGAFANGVFGLHQSTDNSPRPLVPLRESFDGFIQSEKSLFGVMERTAAVESVVFLSRIYKAIDTSVKPFLSSEQLSQFHKAISEFKTASDEFSLYMYRQLGSKVVPIQSKVTRQIASVNWNVTELSTSTNRYADEFIQVLRSFDDRLKELQQHSSLPSQVLHKLWTEIILSSFESLVDGFASSRKCSTEGRAQMSLDFRSIVSGLAEFCPISPLPGVSFVDEYIKAYYYPPADLIKWVKDSPQYKKSQCLALVYTCDLTKKERDGLVQQMVDLFNQRNQLESDGS